MSGQTLLAPLSPGDANIAPAAPELPSDIVKKLGERALNQFDKLKLLLDEMNRRKTVSADDKIIYDFVEFIKTDLSRYQVMKTWAGRRKRTRRIRR